MTIKVYPSHMEGLPIETHEWTGTLAGFFTSNGIDYTKKDPQPITVTVNGQWLPIDEWASRHLESGDEVDVRLNTQHGGVFKGLGNILGSVLGFAFGWLLPGTKGSNYNSPEQGSRLEVSQAKANQVRLGEAVPEIAGRFRRFPDYLTPPRRYFSGGRQQTLEFLTCVGVGHYDIHDVDVKIGNTPFSDIEGATCQIKGPNESWGGNTRAHFWHTVDEVGGTSSGTAGLELSTEAGNRENSDPSSYTFNQLSVTKNGLGYPSGWGQGTVVTIPYPRVYEVAREQVSSAPIVSRNTFTGFFGHVDLAGDFFGTEWALETVENLGGGRRTLAFYKDEWQDAGGDAGEKLVRVWLNNQTIGNRSYTFQPDLEWAVQDISGSELTLQNTGDRFFEPNVTLTTSVLFKGGAIYGEWSNAYVATPAKEKTELIEADLFFPQGLCFIDNEGRIKSRSAGIEIEWRDIETGETQSVFKNYTRATNDQIGFSEQITLNPARQISVRVRRIGAEATSTQVMDTVHWFGLKARLPIINRYKNWTTMAVRVQSGGKLAAQSENQVNVIATRILPELLPDGTWSAPTPTRHISAFVGRIASSIGYTDEDLDMDELKRLNAIWNSRAETCDYIFDLTTVKEALAITLGAGMSELTVADGQIRPVRDGVRTQFEQSYSPQNMTKSLDRTFRARRHDDSDGVEVEYTDGETWTQQTIICSLPGSQHLKLEKLRLQGVTDRTRVWRIGMRRVRELAFQRWEYSFGTEMDALNSEYGGYVALFDDVPGYGQSALLRHIAPVSGGVVLHVSEPLDWEEGKEHVVAYRRPDGTLAGPWAATPGPDEFSAIAPIPSAQRPTVSLKLELPHVYFGTAERWTFPALIKRIVPNGMEAASVSAVNYDERIYADDDNVPAD